MDAGNAARWGKSSVGTAITATTIAVAPRALSMQMNSG